MVRTRGGTRTSLGGEFDGAPVEGDAAAEGGAQFTQDSVDFLEEFRASKAAEAAEAATRGEDNDDANCYDGECPQFAQGCCHIFAPTHTAISALPHISEAAKIPEPDESEDLTLSKLSEAAKNGELGVYEGQHI